MQRWALTILIGVFWLMGPASGANAIPTTEVSSTDRAKLQDEVIAGQKIEFHPFIFSGKAFPTPDFPQPALVRDIIGPYTIETKFYDNEYHQVTSAETPGRYGAIVTVIPEQGNPVTRYQTLLRIPDVDWKKTTIDFPDVIATTMGISKQAARENAANLNESFRYDITDAWNRDDWFVR